MDQGREDTDISASPQLIIETQTCPKIKAGIWRVYNSRAFPLISLVIFQPRNLGSTKNIENLLQMQHAVRTRCSTVIVCCYRWIQERWSSCKCSQGGDGVPLIFWEMGSRAKHVFTAITCKSRLPPLVTKKPSTERRRWLGTKTLRNPTGMTLPSNSSAVHPQRIALTYLWVLRRSAGMRITGVGETSNSARRSW